MTSVISRSLGNYFEEYRTEKTVISAEILHFP